tara:strand:+ start:1503 stop:1886 length:384 start_codon:yes stop_codon:yes gene_type:complete
MTSLNIRQFKLLNGEEIIALVSEKTESGAYIIERPFKINHGMIGGFYFVPWFPFSSQKLYKLHQGKIIYHVEIDEDIKEEYIKLAKEGMRPRPTTKLRSAEQIMDELAEEMDAELSSEEYNESETIH